MIVKDGELALWVTERKQLPDGRWRISVWLNTGDYEISSQIHKRIANLVKHEMNSAPPLNTESKGEEK